MKQDREKAFWSDAFAIQGSVAPLVLPRVLVFTGFAAIVSALHYSEKLFPPQLAISSSPFEFAGATLGLMLVLRTNTGYDRWWEARKLWGGIINQSRILAVTALAHGPNDRAWRERVVRWTAALAHELRHSLRGEREFSDLDALIGKENADRVAAADHMPSFVALVIADTLREGCERFGMDRFAFLEAEQARAQLLDYVGGCERILKSPLPRAFSINLRRFIVFYLFSVPFAMLHDVGWLTPLAAFVTAYAFLSLDQIGVEFQNPFSLRFLGCLPLDEMCSTIERNLLALLETKEDAPDGLANFDHSVHPVKGVTLAGWE